MSDNIILFDCFQRGDTVSMIDIAQLVDIPLETWLLLTVVLLVLTVLVYLLYSGLLFSVEVSTSETLYGPLTFAYKTHIGAYKNVGEIFTESFCLLPDREQLGIYYDDPQGVSPDLLRAAVGPILAKGKEKPDPAEMEKMTKEGFKIAHLPKPSFVVTSTFPFRTTLSIFLAIFKVYPKLRDYIAERNLCAYPAMEIYTDNAIVFMMPLSRQDDFFVSQFQEEEISVATTDMTGITDLTGSVMAAEGEASFVRDKDGFVMPQSPDTRDSTEGESDAGHDDLSSVEGGEESTEVAGEEDQEEDNISITTENSGRSRVS